MIRRIVLLCLALALPALGQTTLNGAGATFPNPMYQKWFSEYHKAHPDIQFNYQSIGSGGGIRQVLAQTVDFGASDGPMTDEQLSQAKTKILHIPTVLGAVVPAYNVPGVSSELKFTPEALAGIFTGQDHHLERSCDCQGEPWRHPSQPDHHRDPPLRRQRHHLHLHRLSLQGQLGVAERAGEGNFREVAGRTWAAKATRALPE